MNKKTNNKYIRWLICSVILLCGVIGIITYNNTSNNQKRELYTKTGQYSAKLNSTLTGIYIDTSSITGTYSVGYYLTPDILQNIRINPEYDYSVEDGIAFGCDYTGVTCEYIVNGVSKGTSHTIQRGDLVQIRVEYQSFEEEIDIFQDELIGMYLDKSLLPTTFRVNDTNLLDGLLIHPKYSSGIDTNVGLSCSSKEVRCYLRQGTNSENAADFEVDNLYEEIVATVLFDIFKEEFVLYTPEETPTVNSITITNLPTKTTYKINENLNLSGLRIKVGYTNGTSADIDYSNGNITATPNRFTTTGTIPVTIYYEGATTMFNVTVSAQTDNYTFKDYIIDDDKGYVMDIPAGTSLTTYKNNIQTTYTVDVETKKVNGTDVIYTGGKTTIKNGTTVIATFTNIVSGDVDGDGELKMRDYVKVYNHIYKSFFPSSDKNLLTGVYRIAADMSGDGGITMVDYVKIYNAIKNGII